MSETDMKWLENKCNEYFKECKKLIERKERYSKSGKDVPEKLNKRIIECNILFDFYDSLIKQNIEVELNASRKRQEAEIMKSLNVRDNSRIPLSPFRWW